MSVKKNLKVFLGLLSGLLLTVDLLGQSLYYTGTSTQTSSAYNTPVFF